jgi:hypothetical protein
MMLVSLCAMTGALLSMSATALARQPEAPQEVEDTAIAATGATLKAVLNPAGAGEPGTYEFLYRKSETECEGESATSRGKALGTRQPVAEGVAGLLPHTAYTFCIRVYNTQEEFVQSPPVTFTTLVGAPVILGEFTTDISATSVTLGAEINPGGAETTYHFEYGPTTAYGQSTPESALISPDEAQTLTAHVQGLQPGLVYHYRAVAANSSSPTGGTVGPDRTFTAETAGGEFALPDGRVWEMVTPPSKFGANINFLGYDEDLVQASQEGNAISYVTASPTEADPQGNTNANVQVLSQRGPAGWSSEDISAPHSAATSISIGEGQEYVGFSSDLSVGLLHAFGKTLLSPEASEPTPYLRRTYLGGSGEDPCQSSCYQPLLTGAAGSANVPPGTVFGSGCGNLTCGPEPVGATPDLSHVLLNSNVALTTPSPSTGSYGLYEWTAGQLRLVSRLPDGEGVGGELGGGSHPEVGSPSSNSARNAIADNGARVVWGTEVAEESGGARYPHLYMSINADEPPSPTTAGGECALPTDACTVQLDAVQGGAGEGASEPEFQAASGDGSKVFFTDTQALTPNSGKGERGSNDGDLYECEIVEVAAGFHCDLTDVTPLRSGEQADVQGVVLGAGEDGSYVYFVARGALAEGASPGGFNLYVLHDGTTTFIATLLVEDQPNWAEPQQSPARVSPNGEWLAFMSAGDLTGYDNRDAITGARDQEVYLYDASTRHLICASCDPTGARPLGNEYKVRQTGEFKMAMGGFGVWNSNTELAANIPSWETVAHGVAFHDPRFLSDSGRLFFDSFDALVPQDVDGTWDVYQYEPPGVGSCASSSATFSEQSGGCVDLISAGTSAEESTFLEASESGGDVFFLTASSLVPQDLGSALDVYDAHECTAASPCNVAPVAPPPCSTGDSCKPAPTPQPTLFGAPSSETFSGAGNLTPSAPVPPTPVKPRKATRVGKLAKALKACEKKRGKSRASCESQARRRFGARKTSALRNSLAKTGR